MNNENQCFIMVKDWAPMIYKMTTEEKAAFIEALFKVAEGKEYSVPSSIEGQFDFILSQINKNDEKWATTRERRKAAGAKGGLAKSSNAKQRLAKPSSAKHNENENENENENVLTEKKETTSPKKTEFSLSDVPRILNTIDIVKDHPEIKEIIYDFYKMRKAIKKPLATESALRKIVKDAIKYANGDPEKIREIFENSVANSWQGVFPLKEEPKGSTDDYLKRKMKEAIENDRQNGCDIIGNIFTGLPVTVQQDDGSR